MTSDSTLFDEGWVPQIVANGDTARTGLNMPVASHKAADRSQAGLPKLRRRVLILVRENPLITGADLNEIYRDTFRRRGWDPVGYDGPRKRAGEMSDRSHLYGGLLINAAAEDEAKQFIISPAGLDIIAGPTS
jgi:hypothetical protein